MSGDGGTYMKTFILGAMALSVCSSAFSNPYEIEGEMILEFGYITQPDGRKVSVKGAKVPFKAYRIDVPGASDRFRGDDTLSAITIYRNDNGDGTYGFPDLSPSVLDDIILDPPGNGRIWQLMTFGVHAESTQRFLVRWIAFDTLIWGRGGGVSAFDNALHDFGGYLQFGAPGDWKVTVDLVASNYFASIPDGEFYFAQQFRHPQIPERGEGPFNFNFSSIFSGGGVTIGASEDRFWLDAEPNGIYDEFEQDYFGGPPQEANLLFSLTSGGTAEDALLISVLPTWGDNISGDIGDLGFSDDSYYVMRSRAPFSPTSPAIAVEVEGRVSAGNILAMTFRLEDKTDFVVTRKIQLFNYSTNQWVEVDSRQTTTSDSVIALNVSNPTQYKSAQHRMRARITYYDPFNLPTAFFRAHLDRVGWTVVKP